MKYLTHKVVLVIQDLRTKDEQNIAVVSGDVHYFKGQEDKAKFIYLQDQIAKETNEDQKFQLQNDLMRYKHVTSFQMALDTSKEFQRVLNDLVMQAIQMKEEKK
jgi:hypothetical protein